MREILDIPALAANKQRIPILLGHFLFIVALAATGGCKIKETIKTEVPPKILAARTASFDELLGIIKSYEQIRNLSANEIKIGLTYYGKKESGVLEKYHNAPGYILLRRPNSVHLVIQNPVTKTIVFDVLSLGNDLRVWYPGKNRFYIGDNRARELVTDESSDAIPIRGSHIFEAVFPQSIRLDSQELRISMEEAFDPGAKYYVLSIYREGVAPRIYTIRRIWIERSQMAIARQQMFLEDGQLASDIEYPDLERVGDFWLPRKIVIDRPLDGYLLNLEFKSKSWRINTDLPDNAFVLTPPEGAETVHLKEKVQ